MLIRHLFLGLVATFLSGIASGLAGWSVWGIIIAMVVGGNIGLLASALLALVPWPRAATELGVALRPSASDPASLPPAE
jgi:hypothetical protein